jgi:hypothetical protein
MSQIPYTDFNVLQIRLKEQAEAITTLERDVERIEQVNLENAMLAYKWMEAHDKLKSGKPYKFPEPADLPNAITTLQSQLAEAREALEGAEITAGGYNYAGWHFGLVFKTLEDKRRAKKAIRALKDSQ